ncbi:amidohydrolase [uncultured Flavobacterium sp.]|uniref:amidohydrolase n=1 Tax=uncultured Flavobacterium sp. TaxID=165435 RepID=UPI0030EE8A7D|tara:strand:- start:52853 stop:53620 length:768 start_codon:yes stop_codon:yes gene_type:complete
MKIALFQTSLAWENPKSNRTFIEEYFINEDEEFDLFVLPEMFTTGFSMNPENVAEEMNGETISWMKSLAIKKDCAVCGSLVVSENNSFYNRFIFVHPNRKIDFYNKRHLFSLAGEHQKYSKGTSKVIIEYKDWKICPQVCYDLRFPAFSRNHENYDLLLYVANWPKPRTNAWDILLKARAVENLCYVVGVNRIGLDENNHEYIGHSQVIDELGNQILNAEENTGVFIVELDKNKMLETRNKLNFLNDKDDFEIIV